MFNSEYQVKVPNELSVKLDIGCGKYKKEGFIGMDKEDFGQEILWDIEHGIPLPDNSVSEVYSSHTFEHLTEPVINKAVWEIKRVCKPGALVDIHCPPADSEVAWDIAHYSRWDETRFKGLFNSTHDEVLETGRDHNGVFVKVKIIK